MHSIRHVSARDARTMFAMRRSAASPALLRRRRIFPSQANRSTRTHSPTRLLSQWRICPLLRDHCRCYRTTVLVQLREYTTRHRRLLFLWTAATPTRASMPPRDELTERNMSRMRDYYRMQHSIIDVREVRNLVYIDGRARISGDNISRLWGYRRPAAPLSAPRVS